MEHAGIASSEHGVVTHGHHFFTVQIRLPSSSVMDQGMVDVLMRLHAAHEASGSYSDDSAGEDLGNVSNGEESGGTEFGQIDASMEEIRFGRGRGGRDGEGKGVTGSEEE